MKKFQIKASAGVQNLNTGLVSNASLLVYGQTILFEEVKEFEVKDFFMPNSGSKYKINFGNNLSKSIFESIKFKNLILGESALNHYFFKKGKVKGIEVKDDFSLPSVIPFYIFLPQLKLMFENSKGPHYILGTDIRITDGSDDHKSIFHVDVENYGIIVFMVNTLTLDFDFSIEAFELNHKSEYYDESTFYACAFV